LEVSMSSRPRVLVPLALVLAPAALLAACGSRPAADPSLAPRAPPLAADRSREAGADTRDEPRNDSTSRVLAYVNGDVVTYRDLLVRIGPQLAVVEGEDAKAKLEHDELMTVLRERVLAHAARAAGVEVSRDDLEQDRRRRVREIERSGGTLEAYLNERGMTRREFDEQARSELAVDRFLLAAIGQGDGQVRVRAMTDTYVSPADCQRYYERNPSAFQQEAGARVRVFAVRSDLTASDRKAAVEAARLRAQAVRARLLAGEDPVPVFRELNRDTEEPDPADGLLQLRKGHSSAAEWIESFAFGEPRGTVGELTQKGTTWYVLYAEGAQEERRAPFEEVQNRVRQFLFQVRRQVAVYEVELALLEAAAVRPPAVKARLGEVLRAQRRKLAGEAGL
jgi:hypothetical protein